MFLNIPKGAGSCLLIITILSRTHTARHFGEHSGRELGILGGERSLEMHAPRLLGCTRRVFWAGLPGSYPDSFQTSSRTTLPKRHDFFHKSITNRTVLGQTRPDTTPFRGMHAPRLLGCTRRVFWAGTWVLWAGTEGAVCRIVLQIPLRKQGLAIISYEIVYVFKHS